MTEVTDPEELARFHARHRRFERNIDWLKAHATDVYRQYRGKHICIADQELFVGDTAQEALTATQATHPDDDGRYLRYIPVENIPRIYRVNHA